LVVSEYRLVKTRTLSTLYGRLKMSTITAQEECEKLGHKQIHLFIDEKASAGDSTAAVRWCICPPVFEAIKKKSELTPYLLLVVTDEEGHEVRRSLLPLAQEMEFISFSLPGRFRIQATVACLDKDGVKWILETDHWGKCRLRLTGYGGDLCTDLPLGIVCEGYGEIFVNVAKEFFAKKPPHWLWWWGNLWHEMSPKDQCQFRKRCILAFSLQPLVVAIYLPILILIRLCVAFFFAVGIGVRGLDFGAIVHPFSAKTGDVLAGTCIADSIFFTEEAGGVHPRFFVPFMPIVVVVAFGLTCGAWGIFFRSVPFWWTPVTAIWILTVITVISVLTSLALRISDKLFGNRREFKRWIHNRLMEERREQRFRQTYAPIVCQGVPLKADLGALPKEKRTFHLRFYNLKRKVCKPFAR